MPQFWGGHAKTAMGQFERLFPRTPSQLGKRIANERPLLQFHDDKHLDKNVNMLLRSGRDVPSATKMEIPRIDWGVELLQVPHDCQPEMA